MTRGGSIGIRKALVIGTASTLVAVGLFIGPLPTASVAAAVPAPTVTTYAGGVGWGAATNTGQVPVGLAVQGNRVLVSDDFSRGNLPAPNVSYPSVVRAIDIATGSESVVAGSSVGGFSGDGGPATRATLGDAPAVTGDEVGNVYVADSFTNRIRKINPLGVITTVAGTGSAGFGGDGGPAVNAAIDWPRALAVLPDRSLIFSDAGNVRIRRIDVNGVITTIAGTGARADSGDGGPATAAQLIEPSALAVDGSGNIYVASGDRIRRISTDGLISAFANVGFPRGITVAADGRVLVSSDNTVIAFDSNGDSSIFAGEPGGYGNFDGDGGPATQADLNQPHALGTDRTGNVYIADTENFRVRRVDPNGVITTFAGTGQPFYGGDGGSALAAGLYSSTAIRYWNGGMYIADVGNQNVRYVDRSGMISTVHRGEVRAIAVDSNGDLFISDGRHVIERTTAGEESVVAGNGSEGHAGDGGPATAAEMTPMALAIDATGDLYIADNSDYYFLIRRVDGSGVISTVVGADPASHQPVLPDKATNAPIDVQDMVVGPDGAIYVLEAHRILRIRCGVVAEVIDRGNAYLDPRGDDSLVIDSAGAMFVSAGGSIYKLVAGSQPALVVGGEAAFNPDSSLPSTPPSGIPKLSLTLDGSGNLYVAHRDRVLKVSGVTAPGLATPGVACPMPFDHPTWAWGWNGLGALGDTSTQRPYPDTDYPPLTGVKSVSAGLYHSLALRDDGTVWAWGWNAYGQLGDGTTITRSTPEPVLGLSGVVSIAAGWLHDVAVTSDGTVWAWGWNGFGQLGDGTNVTRLVPVRVARLSGVTSVSASAYDSAAVKSDGTAWTWGWNGFGQLGDGTTNTRFVPVAVVGPGGITSVQVGLFHSLAVTASGQVWGWGWNGFGEIGDGTHAERHFPVIVSFGIAPPATGVSAGAYHSLAVFADGTVRAWGWNGYYQLGNFSSADSATPVLVINAAHARSVSAGLAHSVMLSEDGTVRTWGWNAYGQLGINTVITIRTPFAITGLAHATSVSAGATHTIAAFAL